MMYKTTQDSCPTSSITPVETDGLLLIDPTEISQGAQLRSWEHPWASTCRLSQQWNEFPRRKRNSSIKREGRSNYRYPQGEVMLMRQTLLADLPNLFTPLLFPGHPNRLYFPNFLASTILVNVQAMERKQELPRKDCHRGGRRLLYDSNLSGAIYYFSPSIC